MMLINESWFIDDSVVSNNSVTIITIFPFLTQTSNIWYFQMYFIQTIILWLFVFFKSSIICPIDTQYVKFQFTGCPMNSTVCRHTEYENSYNKIDEHILYVFIIYFLYMPLHPLPPLSESWIRAYSSVYSLCWTDESASGRRAVWKSSWALRPWSTNFGKSTRLRRTKQTKSFNDGAKPSSSAELGGRTSNNELT